MLDSLSARASVWIDTEKSRPSPQSLDLLAALDLADSQGIDTFGLRAKLSSAATPPEIEQAYNQALRSLIQWFAQGQVPTDRDRLWSFPAPVIDIDKNFHQIRADADLYSALRALLPQNPEYEALVDQLAQLSALPAEPEKLVLDRLIRRGDADTAVLSVRQRLLWMGYLEDDPVSALAPELYDEVLEKSVIEFQRSRGLKEDGILGPDTAKWLNQSRDSMIDQVKVALERWRWLPRELGDEYLLVFTPGFQVWYVGLDDKIKSRYKSISGRVSRPTNSFMAQLSHLVVNPDWTVPKRIMYRDIVPKIASDPEYLRSHKIRVERLEGQTWRSVDASEIDWSSLEGSGEQVRMIQSPGPHNALGQLKFHMPNPYAIYLHDTPHKELFDEATRAFSSGCVRVQGVTQLGSEVLGHRSALLEQLLGQPETKWVSLPKPIPVYLVYMRSWVDEAGRLQLRDDLYGVDESIEQVFAEYRSRGSRIGGNQLAEAN